jgi:cytochrome c oxidase subunit IV
MSEHTGHVIPLKTYYTIFAILMALLVATVVGAFLPLPEGLHLPVALLIAAAKAVLIILYFMHVRYSNRLTWVFSSAAFFWLMILLVFSLSDYATRNWLDIYGK